MSFISKLFRKTDSTEPSDDEPTQHEPIAATPSADQADVGTQAALDGVGAEAGAPAQEVEPGEQTSADADSDAPAGSDDAWWEESTPPAERDELPQAAEPGQAIQHEDAAPPSTHGTQPLDQETGAPVVHDRSDAELAADLEGGTRPLTSGDLPTVAALRSPRGLAVAALRDIGRVRSVNQDSIFAMTSTLPRESGDVTIGLFVVADGMGGHHGGEVASRLAISTVAHHVLAELVVPALADGTTEALQPLIIAAVQEANRAIWEHAQTVGSDMGTTCTVALLLGRALYLGHVGDSRAYLATPTGMKQITNDHSTVGRLIQVGQLDPAEAREHPLRSQLYRTVGQQPDVLVDFSYQQIGDATHLLLASDGLWGMLDDEIMQDVIDQALWPHDACSELIARANLAGGDDNISAIVVALPSAA